MIPFPEINQGFGVLDTDEKIDRYIVSKIYRRGPTECWSWLGPKDGRITTDGRRISARHHIMSAYLREDISQLKIYPMCQTPQCMNPTHMTTNQHRRRQWLCLPKRRIEARTRTDVLQDLNAWADAQEATIGREGCWVWPGNIRLGTPVVRIPDSELSVRRFLFSRINPELPIKSKTIRFGCAGGKVCVNPHHARLP